MKASLCLAAVLTAGLVSAQNVTCDGANLFSAGISVTLLNGTSFAIGAPGPLLIANVASFWGETVTSYTGLNKLATQFPELSILGTPCGQFMNQEPEDNGEILNALKYVRPGNGFVPQFPLTQKMDVNGLFAHSLWVFIRNHCPAPQGILATNSPLWSPITATDVAWNFEMVLVDKQGHVYRRYSSGTDPVSIAGDVAHVLGN